MARSLVDDSEGNAVSVAFDRQGQADGAGSDNEYMRVHYWLY
jgi:hypothetical protein